LLLVALPCHRASDTESVCIDRIALESRPDKLKLKPEVKEAVIEGIRAMFARYQVPEGLVSKLVELPKYYDLLDTFTFYF
jgi:hypothetical protein